MLIIYPNQGDFCNLPFEDNSFDRAYAIEATCHAGEVVKVLREVYRALKPGGIFAFYEWIMTDAYDPTNEEHRRIKYDIMVSDSGLKYNHLYPRSVTDSEILLRKKNNVPEQRNLLFGDSILLEYNSNSNCSIGTKY